MKNNIPLNTKKKSKFSVIQFDPNSYNLTVLPYGLQKQEDKPFIFSLNKLKFIHKKYIDEGKITFQFFQKSEKITVKGIDVSATDKTVDILTSILISSASKENLELLISKIIEAKKKFASKEVKKQSAPIVSSQVKVSQKKRLNTDPSQSQEQFEKMNRKDLRMLAVNPVKKEKKVMKIFEFDFLDLPYLLR